MTEFPPTLEEKWNNLLEIIRQMQSVVVAFSGGIDSALVCFAAHQVLGDKMLAVTIASPVEAPREVRTAREFASKYSIPHRVIEINELDHEAFAANPPDRCYFCKLGRFKLLKALAEKEGYRFFVEGSNSDDLSVYRPGKRAIGELGVRSPLVEAGFTKAGIRQTARLLGLDIWDKPSSPCLATRFPYGTRITNEGLQQVAQAEAIFHEMGFEVVRVRHHGQIARVEVDLDHLVTYVDILNDRKIIVKRLKALGYQYVCLDLEGYRSGSMDEVLI